MQHRTVIKSEERLKTPDLRLLSLAVGVVSAGVPSLGSSDAFASDSVPSEASGLSVPPGTTADNSESTDDHNMDPTSLSTGIVSSR
jgi:hypothetical protein